METVTYAVYSQGHRIAASKPSQPKGIGDETSPDEVSLREFGHQSHLSRKALETTNSSPTWRRQVTIGIKAISAERHWRPGMAPGWNLARRQRHQSHLSRKALETLCFHEGVRAWKTRHQSHLSRKALETGAAFKGDVSGGEASKPSQPKGIGDWCSWYVGSVWFVLASKPSQPKGIGDRWRARGCFRFRCGASKPSQPKGIGDCVWFRGLRSGPCGASKPSQPKGIGDLNTC